jgi:hypothetical protein
VPDIGFVLLVVAVVVVAVFAVLLARRRSEGRPRRGSGVRTMERERSIGYFQDLSGRGSAPGVQEEDRTGRWGEPQGRDRE